MAFKSDLPSVPAEIAEAMITYTTERKARLSFDEASRLLCRWCDSYQRLPVVLLMRRAMSVPDWWRLLGEEWSGFDNVGLYSKHLRRYLLQADAANLQAMMCPDERQELAAMTEVLTVYRGCYRSNADGLSWTLCRETAARFPTLSRYSRAGETPLLLTATTLQHRAVLKLDRKEFEVISPVVKIQDEQLIAN